MTIHYHWGQNIPGYLPMSDDLNIASTYDDARAALIDDMERGADSYDMGDDEHGHAMANAISAAQQDVNLARDGEEGTWYASTDEPHDLGLAYWIASCAEDECLEAWLAQDGGAVPCSRYGRNSADCAPVAVAMLHVLEDAGAAEGDPLENLNYIMGLIVNDHDDPETLILEHADDDTAATVLDYLTNRYRAEWIPEPGGYNLIAIMDDGDALCEQCVRDETNPVHRGGNADGWRVDGWMTTGDSDEPTSCAHCGRVLIAED